MIRHGVMSILSVYRRVLLGCACLCVSCDGARASRMPAPTVTRVEHSSSSAGSGGAHSDPRSEQALPSEQALASKVRPVPVSDAQASEVEVTGPGADVLVVHVQVTQAQAWDAFSVRLLDSKQATLGAFVVPYGSGDNSFPLRVSGSPLARLKNKETAQLQALCKLLKSGGVFPHSAQLWVEFRAEP